MNTVATTLPINDTLKAAWNKIYGTKSSFWAAIVVSQLILTGLMFISTTLMKMMLPLGLLLLACSICFIILLQIGIYYMGIMRAANNTINYKQMFFPLNKELAVKLVGLIIAQSAIMIIPAFFAFIATILMSGAHYNGFIGLIASFLYVISLCSGVYLILGMLLAMGYVLIRKMGPIDAIRNSYKATYAHMFELFVIYILYAIIYFVLGIPFGIGLIWGIPFGYVLYGEIFQRIAD